MTFPLLESLYFTHLQPQLQPLRRSEIFSYTKITKSPQNINKSTDEIFYKAKKAHRTTTKEQKVTDTAKAEMPQITYQTMTNIS